MEQPFRLHPGLPGLKGEQQAEAERFAAERVRQYLSTQPADEAAAEALMAGL
jgi:hypothetical protein